MPTNCSDEALMLRYGGGDFAAFQELYRRHAHGLYNFVLWRCGRQAWVDEIVQEAWASLHTSRERYQPSASFRTFLYQIAKNKFIDMHRAHSSTVLACELGDDEHGSAMFDGIVNANHQAPASDAALEQQQRLEWLHKAVAALPSEQREALALQQFSGMSLTEIAEFSAIPVETIKSRLRYAMDKLRQYAVQTMTEGELL